jgi:chromosome segregation ATPase
VAEEPNPKDVQRLQTLQKRLEDARETGKALTAERNDLKKRLADTEKALTKAQGEADSTRSEGDLLREAVESLLTEMGVKPPARGGVPALIEALQKATAALRERLAAAEEREAAANAALKQADAQAKAADKRAADAEKALEQFREQLAALQQQIKEQVRASEQRAEQAEAALAEAQKTIKALEGGEVTINGLLAENRRLAEQLDSFTGDLVRLRTAADESGAAAKTARAEADAAIKVRAELEKSLEGAQSERAELHRQVTLLNQQIADAGQTPFLTANQVAGMLDGLVKQINLGSGGLAVRDGEVRLKVGFGAAGAGVGFVIPTPEQAASLKDSLHELTLHFDRSLGGEKSLVAGL